MCEVMDTDMFPHKTNMRQACAIVADRYKDREGWFGLEQEYTLIWDDRPLGFPENGYPEEQGQYYCGVGADNAIGRNISEEHLNRCLYAGVALAGVNAEVMAGQWEYQTEASDPLKASDDLWVSRYILGRVAEKYGIGISYSPKPAEGEWNGAGCHTNFSTKEMREDYGAIMDSIDALSKTHKDFIEVCGEGTEKRLTGDCETSNIKDFSHGVSHRGASVRIPWQVQKDKKGYIEDRRPSANIDPYKVCFNMMDTIIG